MKRTGIICQVSVDRLFYYSGDQIDVQVHLDNTQGKSPCKGIEISLARLIQGDGRNRNSKMDNQNFSEIVILKHERLNMDLSVGDRNQFGFTIDIPSVDDTSFMAKFLSEDEE